MITLTTPIQGATVNGKKGTWLKADLVNNFVWVTVIDVDANGVQVGAGVDIPIPPGDAATFCAFIKAKVDAAIIKVLALNGTSS